MQAILILAHKNVNQVLRLAKVLNRRFEIYIHFDTKCFISDKDKTFMDDNGIRYISEVDVNWGSWSIGEAAYRLMKIALNNPDISYVHVISGQDWPVRNVDELYEMFENNDKIYMRYIKAEDRVKSHERLIWWQKFYFNYDTVKRRTFFGKFYHRFLIFVQLLLRVNKFRKLGIKLDIYTGANWMDLPRDAVKYCVDYMESHPEFVKMLQTGCFSDEFWVQTILCNNSEFLKRCKNENHRYIKWVEQYGSNPAVLDASEFEKITEGDFIFARKFDPKYSGELMDKLDEFYGNKI